MREKLEEVQKDRAEMYAPRDVVYLTGDMYFKDADGYEFTREEFS